MFFDITPIAWDATGIMTTHSYQAERSNVIEGNTVLQKIVIKLVAFTFP